MYDGTKLPISEIVFIKGEYEVFNFEVEDDHTYDVSLGNVLVHNSGPCDWKAKKTHNPNIASGFYDVRDVLNKTIYVGKGPSKRAAQSLSYRSGDKVFSYAVTDGVAGLNVRQTAFAFEQLLIESANDANARLKNSQTSPGKKILDNLKATNIDAYNEVVKTFNTVIEAGGKEIKKKR